MRKKNSSAQIIRTVFRRLNDLILISFMGNTVLTLHSALIKLIGCLQIGLVKFHSFRVGKFFHILQKLFFFLRNF